MSRIQLALDVSDLDEAVAFYAKMFGTEPAKCRPGYANFAIADPPLKLVLIEGDGGGTLNHLGVEVTSADEVEAAESRLAADGLTTTGVDDTTCCFAHKTETWVHDPDGAPWEWYVKVGDAEQMANTPRGDDTTGQCCPSTQDTGAASSAAVPVSASGCC